MSLDFPTQPELFQKPIRSVGEITRHIRDVLQGDAVLQDVWVSGEVSSLSTPVSGHVYFNIKDDEALLRCVIWKPTSFRLKPLLADGKAIEVHGSIRVYEQGGNYQLTVDDARLVGEGVLFQEFMRLKTKLEAEGLFAQARKRAIPSIPARIGIVTSPTGAALQDILNVLRRRYPLADVVLAPAAVQGLPAPAEIVQAVKALVERVKPDVILVARGGGSLEDLWAFNDESVVRAIANSPIPVVTGIGHETDFTLADFAADLRAPTPTAAAELVTPELVKLRQTYLEYAERLHYDLQSRINVERQNLELRSKLLMKESPQNKIENLRQSLDFSAAALKHGFEAILTRSSHGFSEVQARLKALDPLAVLERGYALVMKDDGSLVKNSRQVSLLEKVDIRLAKGGIRAEVNELHEEE